MPKITKLDRDALQALRDPINAQLKELADRLGLTMVLGNGSYDPAGAEASFKLVLKVDDPETKRAAAKAEWDRSCQYIGIDWDHPETTGLRPSDFGTEFLYGDAKMRTCGIAKGKGATKFPILCEIVSPGARGGTVGERRMLPDSCVPLIRKATDKVVA